MFVQLVVDDAIVILVCILARDESVRCTWCKREGQKTKKKLFIHRKK